MQDLLTPSLETTGTVKQPLYSNTAMFFTAFFGGGLAVTLLAGLNAWRSGNFSQHWPWLMLSAVASLMLILWYFGLLPVLSLPDLHALLGKWDVSIRVVNRALGLLLWFGFFVLFRREFKAMTLMGINPPSPWLPAIGCVGLALTITIVLTTLASSLVGA